MVEKGASARLERHPPQAAAELAELLDPIALERRLSDARARRAVALAGKAAPSREKPPVLPATLPRSRSGLRLGRGARISLFIFGLCFGAAAAFLLAPGPERDRLAAAVFPVRPLPPPVAEVSAPAAPAAPHEAAETPRRVTLRAEAHGPSPAAPGRPPEPAPDVAPAVATALPDDSLSGVGTAAAATMAAPPGGTLVAADITSGAVADPAYLGGGSTPPALTSPTPELSPPVSLLPALAVRVLVHVSPTARRVANNAVAALEAAGAADVIAVPVRFEAARSEVRFFHGADRAVAGGVASIVAAGTGGALPRTRDFTHFSPQPASGGVEVWLAEGQ